MKDSKQHHIFILAALVSFVLAGCSSVKSTKEPSVRDVVVQVTTDDNKVEEPSLVTSDRSISRSSVRSNSVWTSHVMVNEPVAQGVQGHVLQANDRLDGESPRPPQWSEPVTRKPEEPKAASQSHSTVSVGDALTEVLSGINTTRESTVRNVVVEVIAAVEVVDGDADNDPDEESPKK